MPESTQYAFKHKELVEILVRETGVTEGIWGLQLRFGIAAANVGSNDDDMNPTAIVPVVEIGITKVDKLTNLSVDAATVTKKGTERKGR